MQAYTQRTVPKYSQMDSLHQPTFTLLMPFHPVLGVPAQTLAAAPAVQ